MKKKGFTPPMSHWLAGPLGVLIDEFIPEEKVLKAGLLRPAVVARLVSEHRSRRRDRGREIWTLIALQEWWQRNRF